MDVHRWMFTPMLWSQQVSAQSPGIDRAAPIAALELESRKDFWLFELK